jgi:hypothetical protein
MKNILAVIGVVAAITAFGIFDAYGDYAWADAVIAAKQDQGWVAVSKTANFIDPIAVWTIFKQPVVQVGFVKPDQIEQLSESRYAVDVLWADYRDLESTEEFEGRYYYDCAAQKMGILDSDTSQIEWRDNEPGSPGEQIYQYICKQ